jgi:hypothetical protein
MISPRRLIVALRLRTRRAVQSVKYPTGMLLLYLHLQDTELRVSN